MYLSPHEPAAKPRLTSFQLRLSLGDTVPDYSYRKGRRQILSPHEDRTAFCVDLTACELRGRKARFYLQLYRMASAALSVGDGALKDKENHQNHITRKRRERWREFHQYLRGKQRE